MTEALPLDPQLYPATYRGSIKAELKIIIAIPSIYCAGIFGRAHLNKASPLGLKIFAFSGLILFVFLTLNLALSKVTLYPDRIENRTWFKKIIMRRDEVAGIITGQYGISRLVYKDSPDYPLGRGDFPLPPGIKEDEAWTLWMAIAPTLDPPKKKKI